jgi:cation transport regulator
MPYSTNNELPASVREHIPSHAQTIFREAFNSALEEYKDEARAFKVAWAAVKHKYEKNEKGEWVEKDK